VATSNAARVSMRVVFSEIECGGWPGEAVICEFASEAENAIESMKLPELRECFLPISLGRLCVQGKSPKSRAALAGNHTNLFIRKSPLILGNF
jgi:hypothetical protein